MGKAKRYHRWSTYAVYRYIDDHPRLDKVLQKLFPTQHLWLLARVEWEIGQTFNDPPDEYYLPWCEYWKLVSERSTVKCR